MFYLKWWHSTLSGFCLGETLRLNAKQAQIDFMHLTEQAWQKKNKHTKQTNNV